MALVDIRISTCKKCHKYSPMTHINGRQAQDFCEVCEPIMRTQHIHEAIAFLVDNKVTANMYKKFAKKKLPNRLRKKAR